MPPFVWTVIRRLASIPLVVLALALAVACSDPAPTAPSWKLPPLQQKVKVAGQVTDAVTNGAIAGARVEWLENVLEAWGDRDWHVLTDGNGRYEFSAHPTGFLAIQVEKDGYLSTSKSVLGGEMGAPVNFLLQPVSAPQIVGNGSVTWISTSSPGRALCTAITSQVGSTYPLWLSAKFAGEQVTLSLSHEVPDPQADPPGVFVGTRSGDQVEAKFTGPFGGLACPGDTSITAQTGSTLSAKLTGTVIDGEYTEIYGSAPSEVVFLFHFHAQLPLP